MADQASPEPRKIMGDAVSRIAENADADNKIKDASHRSSTPITVVPHMAGMIDTDAAERRGC
jgi:hypothetical protein